MYLNENVIKQGLAKKGVPASLMCKEIGFSQPSLYRFYASGNIRKSNAQKIIEYLNLENVKIETNTNVSNASDERENGAFERLLKRIEELTIENYMLRMKTGKFEGVSFC
jgi:hypothetical protein